MLTRASSKVLAGAVTGRNDRYLEELKEVLEERCGVRVSESTIWRTLNRVGCRLKEVSTTTASVPPPSFNLPRIQIDYQTCPGA